MDLICIIYGLINSNNIISKKKKKRGQSQGRSASHDTTSLPINLPATATFLSRRCSYSSSLSLFDKEKGTVKKKQSPGSLYFSGSISTKVGSSRSSPSSIPFAHQPSRIILLIMDLRYTCFVSMVAWACRLLIQLYLATLPSHFYALLSRCLPRFFEDRVGVCFRHLYVRVAFCLSDLVSWWVSAVRWVVDIGLLVNGFFSPFWLLLWSLDRQILKLLLRSLQIRVHLICFCLMSICIYWIQRLG